MWYKWQFVLQRHTLPISRKRLISPSCVTAFCECGNSAGVCIRGMQWFRVSAIFPHPPCIGRGVPEALVPHILKRSLPAHRFSAPRSPIFVGFPLTHTQLCDGCCERGGGISLETGLSPLCPCLSSCSYPLLTRNFFRARFNFL